MQARILARQAERGGEDTLLGGRIGIDARQLGAARLPLAARARFDRNELPALHAHDLGGLALGVLDGRGDEDDVGAIGQVRRQCLAQRERPQMIGGEGHIEARGRLLRRPVRHDPGIVEHAANCEWQRRDLGRGAPDTGKIGHVAHHGNGPAAISLDRSLHLGELRCIATGEHDDAMLRQVQSSLVADAGGRTGDHIGRRVFNLTHDFVLTCLSSQSFC